MTIKLRRDSSANWASVDPILENGQPGYDTTNKLLKIGDGVTSWNSLVAISSSVSESPSLVREIRNTTGATLTKGTVIYISGASGNKPLAAKAKADAAATSDKTFGIIQSDISNNANGYAVLSGDISGLNTSAYSIGSTLYLSAATAGEFTDTNPSAPSHSVVVGVVTRSHPTLGQIDVFIQNGYEIGDLHDVSITSKANKDVISYNSTSGLWENKQLASSDISDFNAAADARVTAGITGKENTITAGTTAQYWRGDKTFQTLDKAAVGLSNVDNTSDATKNAASATLTNKTISGANNTLSNIAQSSVTNLTTDLAGKQPLSTVLTNTTASFTTAQESKLSGIAAGATANSSDATLLNRANHTGTQTSSTISDLTESVQDIVGSQLIAGTNVTLNYNDPAGTLTINASGGNSVTAVVDFGATFTDSAQVVVTGQSWVTSNSEITAQILCGAGVDPLELALLDFKIIVSDLVAGVGFTLTAYSAPQARGTYSIMCIGV